MKKLVSIFILLFSLNCNGCFCQISFESPDCALVENIFNEEIVWKYFGLYHFKGKIIILVDTLHLFSACPNFFLKGKEFLFKREYKLVNGNRVFYQNGKILSEYQSLVDIFKIEKIKNRVKIFIGQVESGRFGFLLYKVKKKKYKLMEHRLGQT